jgi:hypothetical protein
MSITKIPKFSTPRLSQKKYQKWDFWYEKYHLASLNSRNLAPCLLKRLEKPSSGGLGRDPRLPFKRRKLAAAGVPKICLSMDTDNGQNKSNVDKLTGF